MPKPIIYNPSNFTPQVDDVTTQDDSTNNIEGDRYDLIKTVIDLRKGIAPKKDDSKKDSITTQDDSKTDQEKESIRKAEFLKEIFATRDQVNPGWRN
jgi:hypothetical protein